MSSQAPVAGTKALDFMARYKRKMVRQAYGQLFLHTVTAFALNGEIQGKGSITGLQAENAASRP